MREIPGTLPTGTRRRLGWRDGHRSKVVPLEPAGGSEVREGRFTVPAKVAEAAAHTNDALVLHGLKREAVGRWLLWLRKRGYVLAGRISLYGPYFEPTPNAQAERDTDKVLYRLFAPFRRDVPLHVGLDDFLAAKEEAERNDVDLNRPRPLETPLPKAQEHITVTEKPHVPAEFAKKRWRERGRRYKDLVIGDPSKPLSEEGLEGFDY